jgi:hypothetical protein
MGRARDLANILSSSGNVALDSELGLIPITPTSITATGGTGLIINNAVGFTSASAISLNGCFSSNYENYLIIFQVSGTSGNPNIYFRMRSGTTDNTDGSYSYSGIKAAAGGSIVMDAAVNNTVGKFVENYSGYPYHISGNLDFYNPFNTVATKFAFNSYGNNTAGAYSSFTYSGSHSQTVSYNGITFLTSTGTMNGVVRVYGYRD